MCRGRARASVKNRRGEEMRGKGEERKQRRGGEEQAIATASQLADLEARVTVLRAHSPRRALCPFIGTHWGAECYWHLYSLHTVVGGWRKKQNKTGEQKVHRATEKLVDGQLNWQRYPELVKSNVNVFVSSFFFFFFLSVPVSHCNSRIGSNCSKETLSPKCRCSFVYFTGIKACSTLIRLPLGDEILVQDVCPGDLFSLCVSIMQLVSSLIKELKCWVSVSPSPSVIFFLSFFFYWFRLGSKPPGHTCDTNRHQTRQCTQTKTDVGMDVLFQYHACCLLAGVSLAFQAQHQSAALWPTALSQKRCEEEREERQREKCDSATYVVLPPRGWFVYRRMCLTTDVQYVRTVFDLLWPDLLTAQLSSWAILHKKGKLYNHVLWMLFNWRNQLD